MPAMYTYIIRTFASGRIRSQKDIWKCNRLLVGLKRPHYLLLPVAVIIDSVPTHGS